MPRALDCVSAAILWKAQQTRRPLTGSSPSEIGNPPCPESKRWIAKSIKIPWVMICYDADLEVPKPTGRSTVYLQSYIYVNVIFACC